MACCRDSAAFVKRQRSFPAAGLPLLVVHRVRQVTDRLGLMDNALGRLVVVISSAFDRFCISPLTVIKQLAQSMRALGP